MSQSHRLFPNSHNMRALLFIAAVVSSLVLPALTFSAESPQLIPFQGRLINAQNEAQPDGKYAITFALYDVAVGGTPVWTERHAKVGVIGGTVNVFLGSINPFLKTTWSDNVNFGTTKYLGITVDADGDPATADKEMSPRQLVLTAFYAPTTDKLQDYGWDVLFGNQNPSTGTLQLTKIPAMTLDKLPLTGIPGSKLESNLTRDALAGANQSIVPSGGIITSEDANNTALLNAGYTKIGSGQMGEGWASMPSSGAKPQPRSGAATVWTGSELIVWGGFFGPEGSPTNLSDGARYNPSTGVWTALPTANAPSARRFFPSSQHFVWTGTEMVIFGGVISGTQSAPGGARFNPQTNTWTTISTVGAPSARTYCLMVYIPATDEVMVWGGSSQYNYPGGTFYADGSLYSMSGNTWRSVVSSGAPGARHTAGLLAGSSVIVWSGRDSSLTYLNDGKIFNPVSNTWSAMTTVGAPPGRYVEGQAVWTGTEMIVYGGYGSSDTQAVSGGARYHLANNTWSPLPTANQPTERYSGGAVWTGKEFLICGGLYYNGSSGVYVTDCGRYNPTFDSWTRSTELPGGRKFFQPQWTGTSLLLFGGFDQNSGTHFGEVMSYTPPRTLFLYQKQ